MYIYNQSTSLQMLMPLLIWMNWGCVWLSGTIAQQWVSKCDICIHSNRHLSGLIWINSECYLYFDITDIQTVGNSFTDFSQIVNNTKRSRDIAKYFVDIFWQCVIFDLPMIQCQFQFGNVVTDSYRKVNHWWNTALPVCIIVGVNIIRRVLILNDLTMITFLTWR